MTVSRDRSAKRCFPSRRGPRKPPNSIAGRRRTRRRIFKGTRRSLGCSKICATRTPRCCRQSERGFELTALGRRVLAGDADWLETHPIDRWIGGVHLTPEQVVRWDEDAAAFVTP